MAKKLNLSYQDIENSLKTLKIRNVQPSDVGYIILQAFGKSDADIRRYREGKGVLASFCGLLIKGLFCFRAEETVRMTETLEALKHDPLVVKATPKIIVVSDGKNVLAYDMREKETYENPLNRMYCDFAFFYPLIGIERFHHVEENPADVKAAEKLAKLHDELRTYNEFSTADDLHDLNIFIARLLFCFFAEDTNIFESNLFTDSIVRYTQKDGSDISDYLSSAFNIMDIRERNEDTLKIISQFPFVNGGLFSKQITIPHMGHKARKLLIECGELDWKNINPDIFGSMIQAVVNPEERANQGMHYTSVPNIMKVINPLFLDELRDEYEKLKQQFEEKKRMVQVGALHPNKLPQEAMPIHRACSKLLQRMSAMKFFDPACGSGNFLIITYKMLRFLEMDILRLQHRIDPKLDFIDSSCIRLSQFYGIELLDFPHEIAMLSLWLAEHQMNRMLHDDFGVNTQALPLKNITQIMCGNACQLDWDVVCPHTKEEEVFVFGNPPYLGSKLQSSEQKHEIELIFGKRKNCKILDYIACWFEKASSYIQNSLAKYAFVSTNSVCQGEQVSVLWPEILDRKQEINFAHTSFKWSNNAKYNAGVTVVIIGVSNLSNKKKALFNGEIKTYCSSINPYLSIGAQTVISKKTKTPEGLPRICFGCMPYDSGHLLFDAIQYQDFIHNYPNDAKYLKRIYGSEEYIKDIDRYCLWIDDEDADEALKNTEIAMRVEQTKKMRLDSPDVSGRKLAEKPYQFREHPELSECIIIPRVSSESREYIPMGYLDAGTVVSDSAFAIYNAETWLFGLLESKMHMAWVRTVGGRLKTDYRYSAQLCYNTFPFPKITDTQREALAEAAEEVLITRAGHPEKTLAEMYDPDKMPDDLREAHRVLDDLVDSCYPGYPFANDEARLECLFKLYEKMTSKK